MSGNEGGSEGGEEREGGEGVERGVGEDVTTSVLTGFLFGNIDRHGRLENDFLDQETCSRISTLASMGVGAYVDELKDETVSLPIPPSKDSSEKAADAIDFFNIPTEDDDYEDCIINKNTQSSNTTTLIINPTTTTESPKKDGDDDEDYELDSPKQENSTSKQEYCTEKAKLNEPTTATIHDTTTHQTTTESSNVETKIDVAITTDANKKIANTTITFANATTIAIEISTAETKTTTELAATPPTSTTTRKRRRHKRKQQLQTPLASMLPSHLSHINVRKYFPHFRKDKVL